jgi:hypothetical protein
MTVTDPRYFDETVGRLRELGHDVRHFTLLAERETVLKRLRERGLGRPLGFVMGKNAGLRRESWAVQQLDHCLERLRETEFAEDYEARREAMEKVVRGLHAPDVEAVVVPLKAP